MATFRQFATDLAADPSQAPSEIATDITVQGITIPDQQGFGVAGGGGIACFGYAGAFGLVDDTPVTGYIDAGDGTVGAASWWFPGGLYSLGYQNEKLKAENAVTEGNLTVQNRPDGASADIQTVMGIS